MCVINGHACVSIIDIIQHMFAHQIPIGFTEEMDGSLPTRTTRNTHRCKVMQELLATMKHMNVNDEPIKYGSFVLWSDGFIRSFVKQKDNTIWIMTVTNPDLDGSATSKYHTYYVAIGKASNNHQSAIDFYLKEVAMLTTGVSLFDPIQGKYVKVQMSLLAYTINRPERHTITHQAQVGVFGKRTLWSAFIDNEHLPYCNTCFAKEMSALLGDQYSDSILLICGRCCQRDMTSSSLSLSNKTSEAFRNSNHSEISNTC